MIAYTKNEMVGITELSKGVGKFFDKIKTNTLDKVAVVRNNNPEAVILPIQRYELLESMAEVIENIEIEKTIQQRVPNGEFKGGFDYESYKNKRLKKGE